MKNAKKEENKGDSKYKLGALALLFPLLYCFFDTLGTAADGIILDEETGLPVWFDLIAGNISDINTLTNIEKDVESNLNINLNSFVLDAGYTSKELITKYHVNTSKHIICRMPNKRGYPYKTLYNEIKPEILKAKYNFVLASHTYFGTRKQRTIFGYDTYVYIYVDSDEASSSFRDFLKKYRDIYDSMLSKDQDWVRISGGYFVLISNICMKPEDMLREYKNRTHIENVIKTSKNYLSLLPIEKSKIECIYGKILVDIMNTIVYLQIQKMLSDPTISMSELFGKTQSLMCANIDDDTVEVFTANKQTKEYYKLFGLEAPSNISISDFKKEILL